MPAATAPLPAPSPVVVTSINPTGRVATQMRAFAAWRDFGLDRVTANAARERPALLAAGLTPADVLDLDDADTGLALFGTPAPRLVPTLAAAAARFPGRPLLLVNADVFPALHPAAFDHFGAAAPVVALTREDCAILEGASPAERAPYRNGLDAFLLRADAVAPFLARLRAFPAAPRMTFGVPGWDFLLGALARSPAVGGRIMDGGGLLHERHPQAYADISEFAHYVGAMHVLGVAAALDAEGAAYEMHRTIVADCEAAAPLADAIRLMHVAPVRAAPASGRALDVSAELVLVAPAIGWRVPFHALAALADRILCGRDGRERIDAVLLGPPATRAHDLLAAAAFELACRAAGAPPLPPTPPAAAEDDERAALAARLRAALTADGTLDVPLFGAVAAAAANDDERALLVHLRTLAPR